MNTISFSAEQYKEMFVAGIITEDDLCMMLSPTVGDVPKSKVADGLKIGNKILLGIGASTIANAAMTALLPPTLSVPTRLIAKYAATVIAVSLAAITANEFDRGIDNTRLFLHIQRENRKEKEPADGTPINEA
jgi:hypothetical protein